MPWLYTAQCHQYVYNNFNLAKFKVHPSVSHHITAECVMSIAWSTKRWVYNTKHNMDTVHMIIHYAHKVNHTCTASEIFQSIHARGLKETKKIILIITGDMNYSSQSTIFCKVINLHIHVLPLTKKTTHNT